MAFMILLKSLIDPSYFRVEEKRVRGLAMKFAKELVDGIPDPTPLATEPVHQFYNSVDSLFHLPFASMEPPADASNEVKKTVSPS